MVVTFQRWLDMQPQVHQVGQCAGDYPCVFLPVFFTLNGTDKSLIEANTNFLASHSGSGEHVVQSSQKF